jgi:hypothetical protein
MIALPWDKHPLLSAILDLLNWLDFACCWAGNDKLWRATGCCCCRQHDGHSWSNVACVNRVLAPKLAAAELSLSLSLSLHFCSFFAFSLSLALLCAISLCHANALQLDKLNLTFASSLIFIAFVLRRQQTARKRLSHWPLVSPPPALCLFAFLLFLRVM